VTTAVFASGCCVRVCSTYGCGCVWRRSMKAGEFSSVVYQAKKTTFKLHELNKIRI